MRVRFLALLVAALSFGVAPVFVHADDTKKDEKPAAKKGACCGDDEKCEKDADTNKKAGTCGDCPDEKKAGCEGCGKSEKAFAKAIACKDCANSEKGPCEKCHQALLDGKVSFVPVSGMMCSSCEGAVSAKLEKIEGIAHYAVMHRFNGVGVFVEPGKTVKLSDIKTALGNGKFEIDETTALAGKYTFKVENAEKNGKTACDLLCKLLGIKDCPSCAGKEKGACLTYNLTDKNVTIKQIKDKLAEAKIALADIEIHGAKNATAN